MKVFISSTYKDLIEYRAAAIKAVEGTSYQAIKMEVLGARPNEPLEACLREIAGSDLFIGIYAHRYGYVPNGSHISITEREYLHAKTLDKPIYCFVVDEENQPWLPKWIEEEPGKSKLKAFKSRIQTDHIVGFFTTADDLGMKVANALSHYVANLHPATVSPIPIYIPRKLTGSTLPTQPYFFGREKELKIIEEALSPESRTWGALIDGPGGIGKTALAIRAAHLASFNLFERKIFITAKVRELTPEGEKPLKDFSRDNYFSILNELALELGEEGITRLVPDERTNQLRIALTGNKTLIIFDNLETLSEEESTRLFQLLSRLPEGNKAIATSRRRRPDIDARAIRLDRMEKEEAIQLIEKLAETNPRLARENRTAYTDLYKTTNGNPLLIKWVCGQLGREGSVMHSLNEASEFIGKSPDKNDPLEYIFGDLAESFTINETKILSSLVYFSNPVNSDTISRITKIPKLSVKTSIEDLIDRAILIGEPQSGLCYLPPLTAKFLRRLNPDYVANPISTIRELAYKSIVEAENNPKGKTAYLEAEWPLISAALPLFPNGNYSTLQNVCKSIGSFLEFSGRWTEWLKLSVQAEKKAVQVFDFENAGWRAFDVAWIYYLLHQPENVLTYASRAENHWEKTQSGYLENAAVLKLKGMAYQLKENYESAIEAFYESVNLQKRIRPESKNVAMSLNDLAEAERLAGNFKAAERDLKNALDISQSLTDDREGTAIYLCNLAELALNQKEWQQAEEYAVKALPIAEVVERQDLIASNCFRLAKALVNQSRSKESLPHLRRAIEIFSLLHSNELQEAQNLKSKIEKENRDSE